MTLKLFVRQSFTQASLAEQRIVQGVIDLIRDLSVPTDIVTGEVALNQDSFREAFELRTGNRFSPNAFRCERFALLDSADAMIVIRTGLSESSAFEIAYNIFAGRKIPIFFAVWNQTPIKTTLLQELGDLCFVCYQTFDDVVDIRHSLVQFLKELPCQASFGAVDFQKI